jgi:hypothetical protein
MNGLGIRTRRMGPPVHRWLISGWLGLWGCLLSLGWLSLGLRRLLLLLFGWRGRSWGGAL